MTSSLATELNQVKSSRIESIDLLRGVVMIIMALDHVRDYFHADAFLFGPTDLSKTNVALFFTRWITHFCAPVFVFLAGTSAMMIGARKGKAELSAFLFKRGIWLLFLEYTVINFAWFFNIHFSFFALNVITGIGAGMIILSGAVQLPFKVCLAIGLLIVGGHNLLESVNFESTTASAVWAVFFRPDAFQLGSAQVFVGYPIIPWAGVMLLGYCFGALYTSNFDAQRRKKILLPLGIASILLFVVIRLINLYGDPSPWHAQSNAMFTFLSFINVTKYPPSLFYILVTLGPAFILLAFTENIKGKIYQYVVALGRVPMFFYIIHIFLIHIIAVCAAVLTGYSVSDMTFNTWITNSENLKGYGFNLSVVYLVWIAVVLVLYPFCLKYERYKTAHKEKWWLSYL